MTRIERDSLGRKKPKFDRSAAGKKAAQTNKEKYGTDYYQRISAATDHSRNRGYFGTLKDSGKDEELKVLSQKGGRLGGRARKDDTARDAQSTPRIRRPRQRKETPEEA